MTLSGNSDKTDAILDEDNTADIAVISMACRFPGASTPDKYWKNLIEGVESIQELSTEQLLSAGVEEKEFSRLDYVKRVAHLDNIFHFDHRLFKLNAREAELLDPQHRLLLECSWEALESIGFVPGETSTPVGVFAGCGISNYLHNHVLPQIDSRYLSDRYQSILLNDKDFLCTRIAYLLGLSGPATTIQTACSTSLVAVHMACQSLLMGECDIALAGGSSVQLPQHSGFRYQTGMILSEDGRCRAFDAKASGTVLGSGAGIVALKRVAEAIKDGDPIFALIKGSAINNDGNNKVGFTAPSVKGQASVIEDALSFANISSDKIGYIEAHGTGTQLGDPIEIRALCEAFKNSTEQNNQPKCLIGSVKTNLGHLDAAAGIAGLMKAILSIYHGLIPPSLNFEAANPELDINRSPFKVCQRLQPWPAEFSKRISGVSSFGMGGTNAHVVLEQMTPLSQPLKTTKMAPTCRLNASNQNSPEPLERFYVIPVSAASSENSPAVSHNLADFLLRNQNINCFDLGYSLANRKKMLSYRKMFVIKNQDDAIKQLTLLTQEDMTLSEDTLPSVIFMFPGQGTQYFSMGKALYLNYPGYRKIVDQCMQYLPRPVYSVIKPALCAGEFSTFLSEQLTQTQYAQPALFIIEYALSRLLFDFGVKPHILIGHSLGEYTAACLADVFSLKDAIELVCLRGKLMQSMPAGNMVAARISIEQAQRLIKQPNELTSHSIEIAAINSPNDCVFSGTEESIKLFCVQLGKQSIPYKCLQTSHAFHSQSMQPILNEFENAFNRLKLSPAKITLYSTATGKRLTSTQVSDPQYWTGQLRNTVKFHSALTEACSHTMLASQKTLLIEVGPGHVLSTFAKQLSPDDQLNVFSTLPNSSHLSAEKTFLELLGKIWQSGYRVNWTDYFSPQSAKFIKTPTYPFERKEFFIPLKLKSQENINTTLRYGDHDKKQPVADWIYTNSWYRLDKADTPLPDGLSWLLFVDESMSSMVKVIKRSNFKNLVLVSKTNITAWLGGKKRTLDTAFAEDFCELFVHLKSLSFNAEHIIYAWPLLKTNSDNIQDTDTSAHLINLAKIITSNQSTETTLNLAVLITATQDVLGNEILLPENAAILGPLLVANQEYCQINSMIIDIEQLQSHHPQKNSLLLDIHGWQIPGLVCGKNRPSLIALRGSHPWSCHWKIYKNSTINTEVTTSFEPGHEQTEQTIDRKPKNPRTWLILGGLGKMGLALADAISRRERVNLILTTRENFPPQSSWSSLIDEPSTCQQALKDKLVALMAIDTHSLSLTICSVNIGDERSMDHLLKETINKYGSIETIIHAAADMSSGIGKCISEENATDYQKSSLTKVVGVKILAKLTDRQMVKNIVCMSSLSALLGGYQMSPYVSANLAMDALVLQIAKNTDVQWKTVNWDAWVFDPVDKADHNGHSKLLQNAITVKEGLNILERLLTITSPVQLAISTTDLNSRISKPQSSTVPLQNGVDESLNISLLSSVKNLSTLGQTTHLYDSQQQQIMQTIIGLFSTLLGNIPIEEDTSFFESGGNSLIATQAISRIQDHFNIRLTVTEFFDSPTAVELAKLVANKMGQEPAVIKGDSGSNNGLDGLLLQKPLKETQTVNENRVEIEI